MAGCVLLLVYITLCHLLDTIRSYVLSFSCEMPILSEIKNQYAKLCSIVFCETSTGVDLSDIYVWKVLNNVTFIHRLLQKNNFHLFEDANFVRHSCFN